MSDINYTEAIIRKVDDKYCIFSKDGDKKLGCYNSKEGALKRLRQIEFFKRAKGESKNIEDSVLNTLLVDDDYSVCSTYYLSIKDKVENEKNKVYYLSDGSVYFDNGNEIIEIDDPMVTDPLKDYDQEFETVDLVVEEVSQVGCCRFQQTDPKKYNKFKVIDITDNIKAILGIAENKSEVQSYLFSKETTEKGAIDWLKRHGKKFS